jgi:hypothetical protein
VAEGKDRPGAGEIVRGFGPAAPVRRLKDPVGKCGGFARKMIGSRK